MGSVVMSARLAAMTVLGIYVGLVPLPTAAAEAEPTIAGQQAPALLPPPDSPTLLNLVELRFPTQGGVASVEYQTYLYYMQIDEHLTRPSQGIWTPFDESLEQMLLEDFQSLWDTGFLADLSIEIIDAPFANGVEGKTVAVPAGGA